MNRTLLRTALALLLCLSVCLGMTPAASAWDDVTSSGTIASGTWGGQSWTLDGDGTLTISGSGDMANLQAILASVPDDVPFSWLERDAWLVYYDKIQKVVVKPGVTSIGDNAFSYCKNLTSVSLPSGVKRIGESAFRKCAALTSLAIPTTVTALGTYAFAWSGLESIYLPAGVGAVSDFAFCGCAGLRDVILAGGVQGIGESAFEFCSALETVSIPSSVYAIAARAFHYCGALETVSIPEGVALLGDSCFESCTSLQDITLPSTMQKVGMNAFNSCTSLTSAWLPDDLYDFGTDVFFKCSSLTSVRLPAKMGRIPARMFSCCSALPSVRIPASVGIIDNSAFAACSLLKYVVLPMSVYNIQEDAFSACTSLTDVYYAGTVDQWSGVLVYSSGNEKIRSARFHYNSLGPTQISSPAITTQPKSIEASVGNTVSFSLKATGDGLNYLWQQRAGSGGSWATVAAADITGVYGPKLTVPATAARNGCQFRCVVSNDAGTVYSNVATLTVKTPSSLPLITVQPASKTLTAGATASFTVEASGIGLSYRWEWRSGSEGSWAVITDADIGGKTDTVLTVPATAARNGSQYRCRVSNSAGAVYSGVATLTVKSTVGKPLIKTQPSDKTAAEGTNASFSVAADGSELNYRWEWRENSSGSWKVVSDADIGGKTTAELTVPATAARNGCQYRCRVSNSAGAVYSNAATLTVRASSVKPVIKTHPSNRTVSEGDRASFSVAADGSGLSYRWEWRENSGGSWKIVTDYDITGETDTTLIVPATAARNGCQYRCRVSNSAGTVYSNAATLTVRAAAAQFVIPANVKHIEESAFQDCDSLTKLLIPEGVESIGANAFNHCERLTSVTLPSSVTSLDWGVFAHCTSLVDATIPGSVELVPSDLFSFCTALTNVTFEYGVTELGAWVFDGCENLRSVRIPSSVVTIDETAFNNCVNLTDVYYDGSWDEWEAITGNDADNLINAEIHCSR